MGWAKGPCVDMPRPSGDSGVQCAVRELVRERGLLVFEQRSEDSLDVTFVLSLERYACVVFLVCVLQRFTAAAEAESRLQLFTHMLTGMVTLFGFMFSWLVFWCLRSMLPSERMRQKEIAEKKVAGIMVQMKKVTRSGRSFREASEGQRFGGVGGVLLSHFDLCCFLVVLFAARLISTFFFFVLIVLFAERLPSVLLAASMETRRRRGIA